MNFISFSKHYAKYVVASLVVLLWVTVLRNGWAINLDTIETLFLCLINYILALLKTMYLPLFF